MRFRSLIYFFLIFSVILFAAGCGGDGSGGISGNDDPAGDNGGTGNGNDNEVIPPGPWLCFTANEAGSTVTTVISYGAVTHTPSLEYSCDGEAWLPFVLNSGDPETDTKITLANAGDKVYLRAKDKNDSFSEPDESGIVSFAMTGSIAASGNVMSLVDKDCTATDIPSDYCFESLFEDCAVLTTAPELPATILAEGCYDCMFYGCSNLISAPALPATELADFCYYCMFDSCSSLTSAPELPATTLAFCCYNCMFSGCTGITSAPVLPATTLAVGCYEEMFDGCSSLSAAPELPATTLANSCYCFMFSDCSNLTTVPELPATILAERCYRGMFYGCSSLTSAPALPATTLEKECYWGMFGNCSELTTAPELPAEALKTSCYRGMFQGCEKLNSITVHFVSWTGSFIYATTDWVIGVKSTGDFYCPSALVGGNPTAPGNFDNSKVHAGWTISILP